MTRKEKFQKVRINQRKLFRKKLCRFLLIFSISIAIMCTLAIGIVFYSPYTRLKELFVTTAMTTMKHQYLARLFLSDAEINRIMEKYKLSEPSENTDLEDINSDPQGSEDIKLITLSGKTYKGYMLIVKDPSKISVTSTESLGKRGSKVEDIVKKNNALGGINGGGFADLDGHGTGGIPQGVLIENYKILHMDKALKHTVIGFDKNNVLVLGKYTTKEIKNMQIRDAVTFKPFLIVNGKPMIKSGDGGWGIAPRTAIGQKKDGTVLLLAIDGRQIGSLGATLKDVQDIMLEYGAHNAANLDGGASTTMVYDGQIVNKPSSKSGPRYVPSAFIIKG